MTDVTQGFVVGKGVVEGVRCDHLAFRAPHVDWQIWIQEGKEPLPRKLVITTRDQPNAPQFSVVVTKWNLKPVFTPQTFAFRAPSGREAGRVPAAPEALGRPGIEGVRHEPDAIPSRPRPSAFRCPCSCSPTSRPRRLSA